MRELFREPATSAPRMVSLKVFLTCVLRRSVQVDLLLDSGGYVSFGKVDLTTAHLPDWFIILFSPTALKRWTFSPPLIPHPNNPWKRLLLKMSH